MCFQKDNVESYCLSGGLMKNIQDYRFHEIILSIGIRLQKARFNYKRVSKKESRMYRCKAQTYILEYRGKASRQTFKQMVCVFSYFGVFSKIT